MIPDLPEYPATQQLSTTECGSIAKRHPRTIVSWIRKGHLPAYQLPGQRGEYRVKFGDLKQLLENKYVPEARSG